MMKRCKISCVERRILPFLCFFLLLNSVSGQMAMVNPQARDLISLNGNWQVILDPSGAGEYRQVWKERKPEKKSEFFEYSFEGGPFLQVPGDFNSQMPELTYLEGTVWYKKQFDRVLQDGKRLFLYFGAVNYTAEVYLNGEKLGSHEGGFTPFQFEISDKARSGTNTIIVKADNRRQLYGVPTLGFDWFNYGGITRDVFLIETNATYIEDYFIQLKKGSMDMVSGWVQLDGVQSSQAITVSIPELDLVYETHSDKMGRAHVEFASDFKLWSPENPKRYKVIIESETDSIEDQIGFRSIEVKGTKVMLNGTPVFLRGVNIHEENPYKRARAFTEGDARILLESAKELGCNFVRLVHYPHSEVMVRIAEEMGLMLSSEIPAYQHIVFSDNDVPLKIEHMLKEMVRRDRNRCGIIMWNLSNETYPSTENRDDVLIELTQTCRELDSSRLITHVINSQEYCDNTIHAWDPLYEYSDLVSINEYYGWYIPWQGEPSATKWKTAFPDKPVFVTEFGGEAQYGSEGPTDEAAYWTEEYQENIYKDQIEMFQNTPNLCGVCPWILYDYRSLGRMNQLHQQGYNRKGLISENGEKKKAWYVMKRYYEDKGN